MILAFNAEVRYESVGEAKTTGYKVLGAVA